MQTVKNIANHIKNTPTWLVVLIIAIIAIATQKLSGNTSIGQLLVLVVFVLVTWKVLSFFFKATSIFIKILLVLMVLAYWLLSSAGF